MPDTELRQIVHLIRQRQPADARRALGRYLKGHPDSAEAWYLLSIVEPDASSRARAAQKAAALDPANTKYGERLARLVNVSPRSRSRWGLLAAVPIVLMLVAVGVVWAIQNMNQPTVTLPTQAAFVPSDIQTSAPTNEPSPLPVLTTSAAPDVVAQPSTTRELAVPTRTVVSAASPENTPTTILPTPTRAITVLPSATVQVAFGAPTNTNMPNPASATPSPTRVPPTNPPPAATANPTSAAPALPTVVMVGAIPLREGADIGGGEMRVVDAVRQAGAAIQDRGGSVPPAPAGQEWVLVELLLICEGDVNCTPDTGAFRLTGASGAPYPPAAGFALAPIFGREVFAAGQVWGYLGFVVPSGESGLWLTLRQGDAIYRFALQ